MKETKKFYIETLGCSKNQVDSEKMAWLLENGGYEQITDPAEAEIIIINTCGFIQRAKEEAIDLIFEMAQYKKSGKCVKLVVAGCLSQRYYNDLKEDLHEADVIFGVGDISQILEAVSGTEKVVIPEFSVDKPVKRKIIGFPGSAYLRISDGCSNHCSYCSIPIIRGELRSRQIDDIIKEFTLINDGSLREINIISQDTSNYGTDIYGKRELGSLLKKLDSVMDDGQWLRVLYLHPDHISDELLADLSSLKHFIPYFDVPFQSGSELLLRSMGRNGNHAVYLELIKKIKRIFPLAVIRSTFITGYPGETVVEFNETVNFIREAGIDWVGAFEYSDEDGTASYSMPGKVDVNVVKDRYDKIMETAEAHSIKSLEKFVGTKQKILIEEKADNDLYLGRFWGQAPEVDGVTVVSCESAKPGEFIDTIIKRINGKDFVAIG